MRESDHCSALTVSEHTAEPYGDIVRYEDAFHWPGAQEHRLAWLAKCDDCMRTIESNDPEYRWLHVGE